MRGAPFAYGIIKRRAGSPLCIACSPCCCVRLQLKLCSSLEECPPDTFVGQAVLNKEQQRHLQACPDIDLANPKRLSWGCDGTMTACFMGKDICADITC